MGKSPVLFFIECALSLLPLSARNAIRHSEILRRFMKLAGWTMVAFALDKTAQLVVVFVLARILGAEEYGRLTLAQGLVNTSQIFVVLGVGTMLARYIPAMREEGMTRAVEIINLCAMVVLATAAFFTVAGLIGAPLIATSMLDLPATSTLPYWMMAWVLLTVVNSFLLTIMLSFEKGKAMGLVSLVGAMVSITVAPILALRLELAGAVTALVAVEAAKAALLTLLYARLVKSEGAQFLVPPRRGDIPLLWRFGLPVFLISALWAPTIWLAQLIVKTQAPNGLAAVGVFGFTNSILGAVIVISSLTNRAALPILSSLRGQGQFAEMKRMSRLMALGQIAVAAAIGLPLAIAAPFIMAMAGETFAQAWPVLLIMTATGILIAGQTALGNYLLMIDRPRFLLMTMVVWALIMIGGVLLYPEQGAYALSGGLLAATIIRVTLIYSGWRRRAPQTLDVQARSKQVSG